MNKPTNRKVGEQVGRRTSKSIRNKWAARREAMGTNDKQEAGVKE